MRPLTLTGFLTTIDEGEEQQRDWAQQEPDVIIDTPPPSPPSPSFAPTGRPLVKARFRSKIPDALNIKLPTPKKRLSSLQDGAVRTFPPRHRHLWLIHEVCRPQSLPS